VRTEFLRARRDDILSKIIPNSGLFWGQNSANAAITAVTSGGNKKFFILLGFRFG